MSVLMTILFLVYPVNTDDINTDAKGLFYNISPLLPEKGTVYLYLGPSLGYGKRPGANERSGAPNDQSCKPVDSHYQGVGTVGAGYTILPQLQLFLGVHGHGNYIDRKPYPLYRSDTRHFAFPQIIAAVKTGTPQEISPDYTLSFGFLAWYAQWIAALASTLPHTDLQREFDFCPVSPHDIEVGARGMTALKSPVGVTYLNLGYLRIIHMADSAYQCGANSYGIGHELDLWQYVRPAIEISKQDSFGSLTPMVKFLVPHLTIAFGVNFPVFGEFDWVPNDTLQKSPRFMIALSPSLVIKKPPKAEPTIVISGLIYDSLSLDPLRATISFMGPVSGKVETKNGTYKLEFVLEGAYQIGVETPDFGWDQRVFHVMAYDSVHCDWAMKRKVDWSLVGKVLDVTTKRGVPANVRLSGKRPAETYSDPSSGKYRLWVNVGDYEFKVSAEGYHSESVRLKILNNETVEKTVYLLPSQYPRKAKAQFLKKKKKKGSGRRRK
jgi:hypothetical protein